LRLNQMHQPSLGLDVRSLDHLRPFLRLDGEKMGERLCTLSKGQLLERVLDLRRTQANIGDRVEPPDDELWCAKRRHDAMPYIRVKSDLGEASLRHGRRIWRGALEIGIWPQPVFAPDRWTENPARRHSAQWSTRLPREFQVRISFKTKSQLNLRQKVGWVRSAKC